jgi:hypothetical protein
MPLRHHTSTGGIAMSSQSQRLSQAWAVGLVLGGALLTGCSVTTGGAPAAATASYAVCAGGHASRFPGREEIGRVCQRSSTLRAIY